MKGKQTALMPGNGDKVGYWLTPPELMTRLEAEFHFDYDPAPFPRPAGFDGLKEDWGQSTYLNPPLFQGASGVPWARKAVLEAQRGKTVVIVVPLYYWVSQLLLAPSVEVRYLPPTKWLRPNGIGKTSHRLNALFILRPKPALEGGNSARGAREPESP